MSRLLRTAVLCLSIAGFFWGSLGLAAEAPAAAEFERTVQPFFREHCNRCHGEKKQKGDLRMDTLARDFAAPSVAMHWADVMDRISAAEMPPEEEDQPKADEAARVVAGARRGCASMRRT